MLVWMGGGAALAASAQEKPDLEVERRIVQYLREHVRPGEPLIVSDLYNNVFKSPEERKVLDRLFNTFFKIPLFVAQYKATTNEIPTLADIARQFNLPVEGEVSILLTIIDSDPRVPKFMKRDSAGEIVSVDMDAVKKDRRFGIALERTLAGWPGKDAPAFTMELLDGGTLTSEELKGKNYLLYFWFTGCPSCVKISPHLVQLQKNFESRNFSVLGINADRFLELDATDGQRAAYVNKMGINFPEGHLNRQMQEAYGNVSVYPTLFLIDAKGVVQKHYVNYRPYDLLAQDLESMLKAEQP
jgi:thiol-disulfide isomerase/thioredoxin